MTPGGFFIPGTGHQVQSVESPPKRRTGDWSGAIAALTTEAGCTGATWGSPAENYDAVAGTTLTHTP